MISVEKKCDIKLLHYLFENLAYKAGLQYVLVILLYFYLLQYISTVILTLWAVIHLLNYTFRFLNVLKLRKYLQQTISLDYAQVQKRIKHYSLSVALTGILWGVMGYFLIDTPIEHHFIIYSIIIGFTYASIFSIISVLELFILYTFPMNFSAWVYMVIYNFDKEHIIFCIVFIAAYIYAVKASQEYKKLHLTLLEEKLHTEQTLREVRIKNYNEQNYIKAIDSIGIGTILVDQEGNIEKINTTIQNWFGNIVQTPFKTFITTLTDKNDIEIFQNRPIELATKYNKYYEVIFTDITNIEGALYKLYVFKNITDDVLRRDILHKLAMQYKKKSETDKLTKLLNREAFFEELTQTIYETNRKFLKFALLFIDLDGFKDINDTHGHAVGDLLLKMIAKRLQQAVRKGDLVGRYAGDEFLIVLKDIESKETVEKIAQEIIQKLQKRYVYDDKELFITASIGIAIYPDDAEDIDILIKKADHVMYTIKNGTKNDFAFYTHKEA